MTLAQKETIKMIKNDAKNHKFILGIILVGSLAKNNGNENSDVDIIVIVDDNEFGKREQIKNYFCGTIFEKANYPVDVDGKVVNKNYLEKIWSEGNECAKNTFSEIKILYSIDKEINEIINSFDKINYNKNENIRKFYALMESNKLKADDDINNILQIKYCIFNTIFFACRLVLEHNDLYYPCLKNLEKEIKKCKYKPKSFIEKMHKLLETYSFNDLEIFYEMTDEYFKEYRFDDNIRRGYVVENEEYWFFNVKPYNEI